VLRAIACPFIIALVDGFASACADVFRGAQAMVEGDSILCHRAEDICPEYATVEEFVAFVDQDPVQVMLWRLEAQRTLESYLHPNVPSFDFAMLMICQHPLLIPGVEGLLAGPLRSNDGMQVIGISAKFVCLDRCLKSSPLGRRPAVVVVEFPELLLLLIMFCQRNRFMFAFSQINDFFQANCFFCELHCVRARSLSGRSINC
jgi:hypothetical protein